MPEIVWKGPSPNRFVGVNRPVAIVNHIMEGTMASTHSWFMNRDSEASTHFGVAKDGRIWQWLQIKDGAYANGILNANHWTPTWLIERVRKGQNPNHFTISIEHEGYTGQPMPEAQYQSSLWLHKKLIAEYKIPADRLHILGHYQIDGIDRAKCPGATFPWEKLMKDLQYQPTPPKEQYFPETKLTVSDELGFLSFWKNNGGLRLFGYPKTPAQVEGGRVVQWFERARFEAWPDNPNPEYRVQLGLLGNEILAQRQG